MQKILLSLGAIALFFAYAWFPLLSTDVYNAPDESMAVFFAQELPFFGNDYNVLATYSKELGGIVHPRSSMIVNQQIVPNMWLGLPWFLGVFHKLGVHANNLDVIVVIVSVLAIIAWEQIIFKFSKDRWISVFAAMALAVHPGWWYFTARGLHPNVLFVSMLIFTVFFWYKPFINTKQKHTALISEIATLAGGLTIGMALFTRFNAIIWILPVLLFTLWKNKKTAKKTLLPALLGIAIPLTIMLSLNNTLYGSVLSHGYNAQVDQATANVAEQSTQQIQSSIPIINSLFPFGIHEINILRNVWQFNLAIFAIWTVFSVFGLVLLASRYKTFKKTNNEAPGSTIAVGILVSIYLLVMYGSWKFNDNPDPTAITIGTSYIRYWLPITVFSTGFIGYAMRSGFAKGRKQVFKIIATSIWMLAFMLTGLRLTTIRDTDGLIFVYENTENYKTEREFIMNKTQPQDIIITESADKYIFPYRNVIHGLRTETTYNTIPLAVSSLDEFNAGIYYFGLTLPDKDIWHIESTRLEPNGLTMQMVGSINDKTLYRFTKK